MSKILAYSSAELDHTFVVIPTLLELRARRHDVLSGLFGSRYGDSEAGGIAVRNTNSDVEWEPADSIPEGPSNGGEAPLWESGEPVARALERLIREERPDAVLVDADMWGGAIPCLLAEPRISGVCNHPTLASGVELARSRSPLPAQRLGIHLG